MDTVPAKTILTRNKDTSWFGSDYNMNLYRGCSHGCIYCDSRSTCYHVEDFDRVCVKENALVLLRDELRRKVRTGVIGSGAMCDSYNPFERTELVTRHALELMDAFGFGASMLTKSPLILRDTDLYQEISTHSPVLCMMTITTADDGLSKKIRAGRPGLVGAVCGGPRHGRPGIVHRRRHDAAPPFSGRHGTEYPGNGKAHRRHRGQIPLWDHGRYYPGRPERIFL